MITVDLGPYGHVTTEIDGPVTAAELVQAIKDQEKLRFKGNSWMLQDTHQQGRVMPEDELVTDGRLYVLTAWLERV